MSAANNFSLNAPDLWVSVDVLKWVPFNPSQRGPRSGAGLPYFQLKHDIALPPFGIALNPQSKSTNSYFADI